MDICRSSFDVTFAVSAGSGFLTVKQSMQEQAGLFCAKLRIFMGSRRGICVVAVCHA